MPSLLNFLLAINKSSVFARLKVKKMIFGGERFPINSVQKIQKLCKKISFYNVAGPTECTCICSAHKVTRNEINKLDNIPVGNLYPYFKHKIVPGNKDKTVGELCLICPTISRGYFNNKTLTKEKFFRVGGHFGYNTGDIVKKINKNFLILGRVDNQIKFMGHRIELEEIENTILKYYKLSDCLIVVKKRNKFPHEKLICYIKKKNSNLVKNSRFRRINKVLPYYMQPEKVLFVDKFKYNKNGKIDRKHYINK